MRSIDISSISFKNLFRNKSRTIVNSLIIALGVIVLTMTVSLGSGVKEVSKTQVLQSMAMREVTILQDNLSPNRKQLDFIQLNKLNKLEHVDVVYPDIQMTAGLYDANSKWIGIGTILGVPQKGILPIIEGNSFKDENKNVVIIPNKLSLEDKVVDSNDYMGKNINIEYTAVGPDKHPTKRIYTAKIVGIYDPSKKSLPPNAVFIPLNDMYQISADSNGLVKDDFFKFSTFSTAHMLVSSEEYVDSVSFMLEDQGFKTNSIHKEINNVPGVVKLLMLVGGFISAIVLISGSISIGATMLQATKNRSKEIGLMKAIGYTNKSIFNIFILEALFTGLLGGVIGLFIAYIGLAITEFILSNKNEAFSSILLMISIKSVILSSIICLIVPYLGSVFPIKKASKINPSEALRSE